MKRALLGCLLAAAAGASFAAQKATPREPSGYRMDDYGALVPATLKSASVLSTSKAFELWSQKAAVFVDVLPRPPRPAGLPKEAVWRDAPRQDIPGSIWLPDTGYGELAASTQRYFEDGLRRATHDDKSKALVLYCRKNCWMSWNAAKRALSIGYTNVSWYPDGADGWAEAGKSLESREPEPRE
ncbi:MAG: PQQ-dependent catabolism-associated CXXCW motif protein [Roseiarcus sp.]